MRTSRVQVAGYKTQAFGFSVNVGKATKGFTLIEVLIALTLLSIMVVLLFTSLKICADSWEKGESKINQVNEIAVVYNFFQHHLSVAKPLSVDLPSGEKSFSFQGKAQSLQFVSAFPASAGKLGLQLFTVDLLEEDNEQYINVTLVPFVAVNEDETLKKEEVTLVKHVSEFKMTYFGTDDVVAEGVWSDEWVNKEALPRLVKINITLANGVFWPEMIFDLKVTGTTQNINDSQNIQNIIEPEVAQ